VHTSYLHPYPSSLLFVFHQGEPPSEVVLEVPFVSPSPRRVVPRVILFGVRVSPFSHGPPTSSSNPSFSKNPPNISFLYPLFRLLLPSNQKFSIPHPSTSSPFSLKELSNGRFQPPSPPFPILPPPSSSNLRTPPTYSKLKQSQFSTPPQDLKIPSPASPPSLSEKEVANVLVSC